MKQWITSLPKKIVNYKFQRRKQGFPKRILKKKWSCDIRKDGTIELHLNWVKQVFELKQYELPFEKGFVLETRRNNLVSLTRMKEQKNWKEEIENTYKELCSRKIRNTQIGFRWNMHNRDRGKRKAQWERWKKMWLEF